MPQVAELGAISQPSAPHSHSLNSRMTYMPSIVPSMPHGTLVPAYADVVERDSSAHSVMLHYQSICCMPAYINYSHEELRAQDYALHRYATPHDPYGSVAAAAAAPFGSTEPIGATRIPDNINLQVLLESRNPYMATNPFGEQSVGPLNPFAATTATLTTNCSYCKPTHNESKHHGSRMHTYT